MPQFCLISPRSYVWELLLLFIDNCWTSGNYICWGKAFPQEHSHLIWLRFPPLPISPNPSLSNCYKQKRFHVLYRAPWQLVILQRKEAFILLMRTKKIVPGLIVIGSYTKRETRGKCLSRCICVSNLVCWMWVSPGSENTHAIVS